MYAFALLIILLPLKSKYLPYIVLIIAIGLFVWIKFHQRGAGETPVNKIDLTELSYSKHARCRMDCRHITTDEIADILKTGVMQPGRMQTSTKGTSYAVEGYSKEKQHIRVVYSPHGNSTVIVTVIDLDDNWKCDCD